MAREMKLSSCEWMVSSSLLLKECKRGQDELRTSESEMRNEQRKAM